jgi:hypothetical protein
MANSTKTMNIIIFAELMNVAINCKGRALSPQRPSKNDVVEQALFELLVVECIRVVRKCIPIISLCAIRFQPMLPPVAAAVTALG